jgi:hypothetical protein
MRPGHPVRPHFIEPYPHTHQRGLPGRLAARQTSAHNQYLTRKQSATDPFAYIDDIHCSRQKSILSRYEEIFNSPFSTSMAGEPLMYPVFSARLDTIFYHLLTNFHHAEKDR